MQFIGNPAYGVHAGQKHGFGIKDYVVADYVGRITAADVFYNFPKIFACDAASVGIELQASMLLVVDAYFIQKAPV